MRMSAEQALVRFAGQVGTDLAQKLDGSILDEVLDATGDPSYAPTTPPRIVWQEEFARDGWAEPLSADPGAPLYPVPWRTGGIRIRHLQTGHDGPWLTRPYEAAFFGDDGYKDFMGSSWNSNPFEIPAELASRVWRVEQGVFTIAPQRIKPGVAGGVAASWTDPDTGIERHLAHVEAGVKWLGGMIATDPGQGLSWRYGYFETRFKYRHGRGGFPGVWLYNARADGVARKDGHEAAELDLFEVFGQGGVHSSYHMKPSPGVSGNVWRSDQDLFDPGEWHRYGYEWTPDRISLWVDGVRVADAPPEVAVWMRDADLGWRVTMAVDPSWEPDGSPARSTATDPAQGPELSIDYMRVYDRMPTLPAGSADPMGVV